MLKFGILAMGLVELASQQLESRVFCAQLRLRTFYFAERFIMKKLYKRGQTKRILTLILALILVISPLSPTCVSVYALSPTYTVSSSYSGSSYYTKLCNVSLSGDQQTDIVNVALSQLGYREGGSSGQYSGADTGTYNNYCEYNYWYHNFVSSSMPVGGSSAPWCATFVSWCARQAGIPTNVLNNATVAGPGAFGISYYAGGSQSASSLTDAPFLGNNYTPKPGDIFFKSDLSHVGIVRAVSGSTFTTIEGNTNNNGSSQGNGVYSLTRSIASCYFGVPNYSNNTTYTININANGGIANTSSLTVSRGEKCNLSIYFASREGYGLQGWNLYRPADGKWFVGGEGWFTASEISANGYTKQVYIPDLSMTLDSSWFTNASTSNITSFTFYAVWNKNYTISIDGNGGTSNQTPFTVAFGQKCNLSSSYVSKSGYILDGWNLYRPADGKWFVGGKGWFTASEISANGYTKQVYIPDLSMTLDTSWLTSSLSSNVKAFTFYAVWKSAPTMTVTFNANGGSVSPISKTVTYGATYGTLPTPTCTYYNFDGWYTSASGGSKVTASTTVTATTNHTLYAHWTHVCANGHNYSYAVTTTPTTSATGVLTGTCSRCGNKTTITLPKLSTTDYNYSVTKAATCTATGTGRYTWKTTTYGTFYFDVTIPKTAHSYTTTVTQPTCTAQGYTTHTCSVCGDSYKDSYTNVLGHAWDNGVVTKPATDIEPGVKTFTCTRCGETKTEIIPKLDGKPNPFVDVAEGQYYYAPVLWAYYHTPRVTGGTDKTHFSPNQNCTREQIVTFIWKAYGGTAPKMVYNPFQDVKSDQYYYNAVLWAVENGITSGVGGGKFGVSQPCTREQVVTFLWTAAGKPEPTAASNPFKDVKAGQYYYKPVLWAVENGITKGMTADTFGVGKTCTRAQVVTFLYKAVGQGE